MDEPWSAQWIVCDGAESPRHPIFSRTIALAGEVLSARLYACGLGFYDASINGERVGDEYLAPGTNAYDRWLQVQTYDVTEQLRAAGEQAELSFLMGNGWWKGRFGFIPEDRGFYGNDWRLIAELHVTYADGSEQVFGTGEGWTMTRSNITGSNIYDGMYVDDTLPAVDSVPAALLDEDEAAAATAKLTDRLSLPVRAHETFSPTVVDVPSGDLVLDMGQEFAGTFRLRVSEPAGTKHPRAAGRAAAGRRVLPRQPALGQAGVRVRERWRRARAGAALHLLRLPLRAHLRPLALSIPPTSPAWRSTPASRRRVPSPPATSWSTSWFPTAAGA